MNDEERDDLLSDLPDEEELGEGEEGGDEEEEKETE